MILSGQLFAQPRVETLAPEVLSDTVVVLHGELVDPGTAPSVFQFFQYRRKATVNWNILPVDYSSNPGQFEYTLSDLQSAVEYEFRAAAEGNSRVYGDQHRWVTDHSLVWQTNYDWQRAVEQQRTVIADDYLTLDDANLQLEKNAVDCLDWENHFFQQNLVCQDNSLSLAHPEEFDTKIFEPTSTGRDGEIQQWVVPFTGEYRITAYGAAGGGGDGSAGQVMPGGAGARMAGNFQLKQGETVEILVGHRGEGDTTGAGGGGGSFVVLEDPVSETDILLIAGGGGGGGEHGAGVGAVTASNGTQDSEGGNHGGVDGYGGQLLGGAGTAGNAGSGAGIWGDGEADGHELSLAFINGGIGGSGGGLTPAHGAEGGFGGGGGGFHHNWGPAGGGGGGYSGGAGAYREQNLNRGGGGGGSYNNGTAQSNQGAVNQQDGLVIVEVISREPGFRISQPLELSEIKGVTGSYINWQADQPGTSTVKIDVAISHSPDTYPLDQTAWSLATPSNPLPGISPGDDLTDKYLWLRQRFYPQDFDYHPQLNWLDLQLEGYTEPSGHLLTEPAGMLPSKPVLVDLEYRLNGGQIELVVVGSPDSSDSETVGPVILDGSDTAQLDWEQAHAAFQVKIYLEADNLNDFPEFSNLTLVPYYSLNVTKLGEGEVAVNGFDYLDQFEFRAGESIVVTAEPAPYSSFLGWAGEFTGKEAPLFFSIDQDYDLTAIFGRDTYLLTVELFGPGQVQVNGETYPGAAVELIAGETVTLQADPVDHYIFTNWGYDITAKDDLVELFIDQDFVVSAHFDQDYHELEIDPQPGGQIFINGDSYPGHPVQLPAGETATLEIIVDPGWEFAGWSGDFSGEQDKRVEFVPDRDLQIGIEFSPVLLAPGLSNFIVGPNPFIAGDGNYATGEDQLLFQFNSTASGPFKIKIYSIGGGLVFDTVYRGSTNRYHWSLKNNSGRSVSSGYYIYYVEELSTGASVTGKLAVVR